MFSNVAKRKYIYLTYIFIFAMFALSFVFPQHSYAKEFSSQWRPAPISNDGWVNIHFGIDVKASYSPGDDYINLSLKKAFVNFGQDNKNNGSGFMDAAIFALPPDPGVYYGPHIGVHTDTPSAAASDARGWAGGKLIFYAAQNNSKWWSNGTGGSINDGQWHSYRIDVRGLPGGSDPVILIAGSRWLDANSCSRVTLHQELRASDLGIHIRINPKITASADSGSTVSPYGTKQYAYGTSQATYNFAAKNMHKLDRVVIDGRSQGVISSYTFRNITSDHTVAVYSKRVYPLLYDLTGGKSSSIIQTEAQAIANNYAGCYEQGQSVTLTSNVPTRDGFRFLGWSESKVPDVVDRSSYLNATRNLTSRITMPGQNKTVYAVWADKAKEWKKLDPVITSTTKLIKVVEDGSVKLTYPTGNAEDVYKRAPVSYNYKNKTSYNEQTDSFNITAEFVNAKHTIRFKKNNYTLEEVKIEDYYTTDAPYSKHKTIRYNTITPDIEQIKYRPLSLNRTDYVENGDGGIDPNYSGSQNKIIGSISSEQGSVGSGQIPSLDINSNVRFRISLGGVYGMPDSYNWNNTPPSLSNSTWENAGPIYCNGKNNQTDSDNNYRHDLKLYMSVSNNRYDQSVESSSMIINGQEIKANQVVKKSYPKDPFTGGDVSFRFTYADDYTTDNNQDGSKFPSCWVNRYQMSRFYEYGTEYSGTISGGNIGDPSSIAKGVGSKVNNTEYLITIDANKQQRGFYVTNKGVYCEQPVLFADIKVKTLAGGIN